jgi:hypothetical protein
LSRRETRTELPLSEGTHTLDSLPVYIWQELKTEKHANIIGLNCCLAPSEYSSV